MLICWKLYNMDKSYEIHDDILKHISNELIKHPTGDGVRRAKFILRNKVLTKLDLERIKHDFKIINDGNKIAYELAGGNLMMIVINKILNSESNNNKLSKEIKQDSNVNVNSAIHAQQNPRIRT